MTGSRRIAVPLIVVGMLLSVLSLWRPALAFEATPDFQGECTSATYPMTCTLDEPEGVNPATHGTITIERVGNVFTFTWDAPQGASLAPVDDAVKLCVEPKLGDANPFVPTDANTCVGAETLQYGAFPVVYDATALLAGASATDVWFALHVDIRDGDNRTTYVVGPGVATIGSTTTSSTTSTSTTTTSTTTTTTLEVGGAATSTPPAAQVAPADDARAEVLGLTLEAETLPRTGSPLTWPLALGLALVVIGFGLLLVGRRPAGATS